MSGERTAQAEVARKRLRGLSLGKAGLVVKMRLSYLKVEAVPASQSLLFPRWRISIVMHSY
jgi:hypothetical protein